MRERRPGVWELIVQLPRDVGHGRAKQLSRSLTGTKREAQRALAALVAEVDAGKITSSSTSMSELFDRWLEHVEGQLSPTTAREYRRLVAKMLGPALGHLPLRKITTRRIDEYYAQLSRERRLSPGTIRHAHAVVRGALTQAHKWGWIPTNPTLAVSLPRARRKEIIPPAIGDMRVLLAQADARDPDFGALLRVLTATGARRGEVCGLRWTDLDQDAGTLFIRRSVASIAGGTIIKDTKTHAARKIALDTETLSTLDRHRTRRDYLAAVCRVVCDEDGFVFTSTPDGSLPLHPDTITGRFGTLCRSLGLTGVRLHDLRHLHATQLLAAGVPVRTVSGRLGHANAATTLNVYAHALEVSDRHAADVIGGLLQSPAENGDSRERGHT